MASYVSTELRRQISADAKGICGYCRSRDRLLGIELEVEHLIPESKEGATVRDNLWMACRRCNLYKTDRGDAVDPKSGDTVLLFNPRADEWESHFKWVDDSIRILGLTKRARATVEVLKMNHPFICAAREVWVQCGKHPPGFY